MEGILLFCVLGAEIFTRYRLAISVPHRGTAVAVPPVEVRPTVSHGETS
jgi:hypothetical protein